MSMEGMLTSQYNPARRNTLASDSRGRHHRQVRRQTDGTALLRAWRLPAFASLHGFARRSSNYAIFERMEAGWSRTRSRCFRQRQTAQLADGMDMQT
jgi:hypothetical protein